MVLPLYRLCPLNLISIIILLHCLRACQWVCGLSFTMLVIMCRSMCLKIVCVCVCVCVCMHACVCVRACVCVHVCLRIIECLRGCL